MGKKMKLPFLSKVNSTGSRPSCSASPTPWPWPSYYYYYCHQPRTLSFRTSDYHLFNTINSAAYLEANHSTIDGSAVESAPDSLWFTNTATSSGSASFSIESEESAGVDAVETVIRGLRSERLFFEPGGTSSIMQEAKAPGHGDRDDEEEEEEEEEQDDDDDENKCPFKESVVLSMDSRDPFLDFKKSMEEMVEAHGLKDWEALEELLYSYLRVNGKSNHGYIVGAFVDLLASLAFDTSTTTATTTTTITTATITTDSCSCSHDSPSSPLSFYTSSSSDDSSSTPCVSSQEAEEEIDQISPCLSSLEAVNNKSKQD